MPQTANLAVDGGWWLRHAHELKTIFRIGFGLIWLIDGSLKFLPGFVDNFPGQVANAAAGAPPWLAGWYSFWVTQANSNPGLIVYTVGSLELLLGFSLVFGFARKVAYLGGAVLSILIWAVPEGFGGPYSGGTGTDVGVGIVYALLFLGLAVINAAFGPSHYSLDYLIEKRFPAWAKVAEMGSGASRSPRRETPPSDGARA